jgi:hypothetical protein
MTDNYHSLTIFGMIRAVWTYQYVTINMIYPKYIYIYTYIYLILYKFYKQNMLVDCIFTFCPVWYIFDLKLSKNKAYYLKGKTFTLEQATKAQKGVTVLLLSSRNLTARRGWVVNGTPRPFYQRQWPGARCTGGWLDPMTRLDGCGKRLTGIRSPGSPTQAY